MDRERVTDRAIEVTSRFYKRRIDKATLRVQVEDFEWQGAVYRIDVCCDEYPVFAPYPSDFARAHRIWMSASGSTVRQETIYTMANFDGMERSSVPADRVGLYPGHATFARELAAIDAILARTKVVNVDDLRIELGHGVADLARYRAGVTESSTATFAIGFEANLADPANAPPYCFVGMTLSSDGITDAHLDHYTPPDLI